MRPLDLDLLSGWRHAVSRRRQGRAANRIPATGDRRAHPRFPLANTELHNHSVGARVLDLGRGGMAIESNSALRPGRRYTFTLTIGEHLETVDAVVLWCRLLRTERLPSGDVAPVFRAGIERIRPDPSPGEADQAGG